MKKTYMKPESKIIVCKTETVLLAGSDIAVGNEYSGTTLLSRSGDDNWDDED